MTTQVPPIPCQLRSPIPKSEVLRKLAKAARQIVP
jgi:hypothetical protein